MKAALLSRRVGTVVGIFRSVDGMVYQILTIVIVKADLIEVVMNNVKLMVSLIVRICKTVVVLLVVLLLFNSVPVAVFI